MGVFGVVQAEDAGDRIEHLRAGVDRAPLLEPGVPGDPHPGQLRDLLTPKPRRAATQTGRETCVIRCDQRPAAAQERRQLSPTLPAQCVR